MKQILLHIKGNMFEAGRALHAHGINPLDWLGTITRVTDNIVSVSVKVENEPGVIRWFCETSNADLVPGFGFPDGTLLDYSITDVYERTRWTYDARAAEKFSDPDAFICNRLNHVPFMAWLAEARDQRDAQIMRELTARSK